MKKIFLKMAKSLEVLHTHTHTRVFLMGRRKCYLTSSFQLGAKEELSLTR